jgi:hypothetical protein
MLEGFSSLVSPGHARMHIDACSPDSNRRATLVRLLVEGFSSLDASPASTGHGLALTAAEFRVLAFVSLVELHPCQQAASHLACTRPPDSLLIGRPLRPPCLGRSQRAARAFVTTRAGTDTMARHRLDTEVEITEADDTVDAATFGGASLCGTRQVTPPSMPADLRTTLAMPTTFGPKLFEITALHTVARACKVKVKDTRDLLLLRDWLFEELGLPCMWTVMLFVVEWEHLTDNQKELHHTMRESWLSSYSKVLHTVLQHWLWRFLKKQTESFAPLHKVFAKIKVDSPDSGTSVLTEIFLMYPVTCASIAHKLLARGLKTCLGFKNDSMASALDYINSVNASAFQLSHVQPMTVQDVYALVTLMGLYLSEASGHQKAYKKLLAHIDDGHALTIDKVQHEIIRYSHSRAPRAFALTHTSDSSVCNHLCPRFCDTRGETPRPSRSSSSPRSHSSSCAGSPRHTFSATAAPLNTYWRDQGLDPQYHTFAAILQSNFVSPHQVILDGDIDHFGHPDDGHAFMRAAANYPKEPPSDEDSA